MLRILLAVLLLSLSAAAAAAYKCEAGGKTTYSETPCPGGKTVDLNDNDAMHAASPETVQAQRQLAAEKKKVHQLETARHQREAKEARRQQSAARTDARKKQKCAALELRKKWSEEDLARATGKNTEKAKLRTRRMHEKYALECA